MRTLRITALIILSIIVGTTFFVVVRFTPFTLVIHTRTLEKRPKNIIVTDTDNKSKQVKFEIGSDNGDQSLYTIELPRVRTGSVVIPPLASLGKYEINRVTLYNDKISYNWDENMECTQQILDEPFIHREGCSSSSPIISYASDSSLVISQIPDIGVSNPTTNRIVTAIIAALVMLLSGIYILGPTLGINSGPDMRTYAVRAAWLGLILLYLYQFYHLWEYSVDVPYWEEWEFFDSQALPNGFTWKWLLSFVSHHRIVFTKLMAWINLKLFSLDFVTLKLVNYALFGGLVITLVKFKNIVVGKHVFPFFPLFLVFLMSPIAYEDHAASFQSQFHFVLIFSIIALYFAFSNTPSFKTTLTFSFCVILAVSSLSAGIVLGFTFLLLRTVYFSAGISSGKVPRKAGLQTIFFSWAVILPGIILWMNNFKKPEYNAPWLFPSDPKYWDVFLNLLSFGFGFEIESPVFGLLCLVIVLTPLVLLINNEKQRWLPSSWQVISAILGILAVIGLIGIGRGNLIGIAKTSRYAIFSFMLIPFSALAWWLALEETSKQYRVLAIFWLFCLATYWNNWNYTIYRDLRQIGILNLECVERYSNRSGDGLCIETHPRPIGDYFDNAKKLDVHFTRQFGSNKHGN